MLYNTVTPYLTPPYYSHIVVHYYLHSNPLPHPHSGKYTLYNTVSPYLTLPYYSHIVVHCYLYSNPITPTPHLGKYKLYNTITPYLTPRSPKTQRSTLLPTL